MSEKIIIERFAYSLFEAFGKLIFPEFECFTVKRKLIAYFMSHEKIF